MKLERPRPRVVKIQVLEIENGSRAVKGSVRNVQVYDTTSDEVFDLILAALKDRAERDEAYSH